MVLAPAIAEAECRRAQRTVDIAPIRDRSAIHRDRAAIAVIGCVGEILVRFELRKSGRAVHDQPVQPRPPSGRCRRARRGSRSGRLMVELPPMARPTPEQQRLLPLGASRQQLRPTEVDRHRWRASGSGCGCAPAWSRCGDPAPPRAAAHGAWVSLRRAVSERSVQSFRR